MLVLSGLVGLLVIGLILLLATATENLLTQELIGPAEHLLVTERELHPADEGLAGS